MVLLLLSEEVVGGKRGGWGWRGRQNLPLVFPPLIISLYRGLIPILQFLKERLQSGGLVSLLVISVTDGAFQ